MSPEIIKAGKLYVTNRAKFMEKYGDSLHKDYLDTLFLESETRPQLAETLALLLLKIKPVTIKKYDGELNGRPVEAKCRVTTSEKMISGFHRLSINDVSKAIVDRYDADNPLFVFPYYVDGHLAASFTVDYSVIRHKYIKRLAKPGTGRVTFQISPSDWNGEAKLVYVNKDKSIVAKLPLILRKLIAA